MTLGPFSILNVPFRRHRRYLAIALGTTLGAQLVGIPFPLLTRSMIHIVGNARNHHESFFADPVQALWIFAAILGGLVLLRGFLGWQKRLQGERLAQFVLADVRSNMYAHLQTLSQGYFDRRPSGKILIRFVGDANTLRTWIARTVIAVPADALTIVAVAIAMSVVNAELLVAAVIPLVLILPALALINPRTRTLTRAVRSSQSRLCGVLNERLASLGMVKAAGAQDADRGCVQELIDAVAAVKVKRAGLDAWARAVSVTAVAASLGAVGVWGTRLYLLDNVSQADLLAAVWLTVLFRGPIRRLASANLVHQRARVAVERIGALLAKPGEPGWSPELPAYSGPGLRVELKRLGYRGADGEWLFHRLDVVMHGPGLVCLTSDGGQVGATLLELLLRLRRPHKGRICLDGADIRKIHVASVRRNMGFVDRDHRVANVTGLLLDATVGKNEEVWSQVERRLEALWPITQSIAPSGELSRCMQTLRAHAHRRWIESRLACDERLRFSICCALLNDPPILLLDDPTHGLNPSGVQRLVEWLDETARSRLVIAATNDERLIAAGRQVVCISMADRKSERREASRRRRTVRQETSERTAVAPPTTISRC